jgi:hypothetical protein
MHKNDGKSYILCHFLELIALSSFFTPLLSIVCESISFRIMKQEQTTLQTVEPNLKIINKSTFHITISLLLWIFVMSAPLFAQNQAILFKIENIENTNFTLKLPGDYESRAIKLNSSLLADIESNEIETIILPVTDDDSFEATIQKVIQFKNGGWSAIGIINGNKNNSFVFSYSPSTGKAISSIENIADHSFFEIRYSTDLNRHILAEKDPHQSDELSCGHNQEFTIETDAVQSHRETSNLMPSQDHGPSTIDVLIAYTPQALNWANTSSSGIDNIINQSMARAQLIADNSDVDVQFQLVHSQLIEYEETGNSLTDLRRLTASPSFNPWGSENAGFMDEIHPLRNAHSADLVALFTFTSDVGGIAWVINNSNGLPRYGFSVSRIQQAAGRTHAHEMGHNFGNAHSRNQSSSAASASGGLFPYSTGWRWNGNDGISYASVMTYAEGSIPVNYFSNPDVSYQGVPTGSYEGQFAPADNARSMNEIRHAIENYRTPDSDISVASVSTSSVSNISYSLAEVGGTVTSDGGTGVTQRGICWSSEQNPNLTDNCLNIGSGLGTFQSQLTDLNQNSEYYVRAYAINAAGTAYGEQQGFTTLKLQKPEALSAETVNAVSFTARWSDVPDAERYYIDVSSNEEFSSFVSGYEDRETATINTFLVEPLSPGTNYYYRVRAGAEATQSENSNIQQVSTTDISQANSDVSVSRDRVLATGVQQSVITVSVQNSNAEPVEGAVVSVETNGGSSTISPQESTTDAMGLAVFSITNGSEETIQYNTRADGLILNDDFEIEFLFSDGSLRLGNNCPNPYNNQTRIPIVIPQQGRVRLDVYNSVGSLVQTILDEPYNVGYYEIPFNATGLSSGVYFYRLVTDQGMRVEKMLLAK